MRWPLVARKAHKWLALLVGVQALLWTMTGFYMVVVHIDTIHGDHLVRQGQVSPISTEGLISPAIIARAHPGSTEIRLVERLGRPVWRAQSEKGIAAFDAVTSRPLPPVGEAEARQLAGSYYAGAEPPARASLITQPLQEMGTRPPPYWQVEFPGWARPTLYISPATGELLAKRHMLWRVYDFAWMLHIMDYRGRTDVNNPLLRVATWGAFTMALTGAMLLFWSFPRRKKKAAR